MTLINYTMIIILWRGITQRFGAILTLIMLGIPSIIPHCQIIGNII